MNAGQLPILVLNQACRCTVAEVTDQLSTAGYSVVQSFDLHSTLENQPECPCQMVVLLVYPEIGPPATLIVDGNDHFTSVFLENAPDRSFRTRFSTLLADITAVNPPC